MFSRSGGINPSWAQEFHRENIENIVTESLAKSKLTINQIDAIAVTAKPGLIACLQIGLRYAKHLARKYHKPLIPIHHMKAHAVTARLENPTLKYPFLCLLVSGGHCQLVIVWNVNKFHLLGDCTTGSPGECFDKIARKMGLHNLPEYSECSGGQAIELAAAKSVNPNRFEFPVPFQQQRNCQFFFGGIKDHANKVIHELQQQQQEQNSSRDKNQLIPHYEDLCAAILKSVTMQLLRRTQRAMHYCERIALFGYGDSKLPKAFVLSGGVACNDYIYTAFNQMVNQFGYTCYRPSKRLCSDNGVMIAWNGIEKWIENETKFRQLDIDSVLPVSRETFAVNLIEDIERKNISCDWVKVPAMQ